MRFRRWNASRNATVALEV